MKFSCILSLAIAGQTISACQLVNAKATDSETDNSPRISIQEITVKAYPLTGTISSAALSLPLAKTDSAELLKKLPGAAVNRNGAISGIAQYRGLFGHRVSVALDSSPVLSGGPNAMDTKLSYAPVGLLSTLDLHRGIAPVSAAQESLGGHLQTRLDRGEFNQHNPLKLTGSLSSQFIDNGQQSHTYLKMVAANNRQKGAALFSLSEADIGAAGNSLSVPGSQYHRSRSDLSYAWQSATNSAEIYWGQHRVKNTGTPALAMDIANVDTELLGLNLNSSYRGIALKGNLAWSQVDHGMDNFSLRQPPPLPINDRTNQAKAERLFWALKAVIPLAQTSMLSSSQLTLGSDGNLTQHHAVISNPQNSLFELINFNGVDRDIISLFAELDGPIGGNWQYQLGLRAKRISSNAAEVAASGLMGMMGTNINALAMQFNQAQRKIQYHNTDWVLKLRRRLSSATDLTIDLGSKQRAPSYQELYLWLPLPITGGLADGRSYLGNLQLNAETSNEINLGIDHSSDKFSFAPQIFYRRVNDYIQGMPSNNLVANRVSTMMSGAAALIQSNINAEIYGVDADWQYRLNPNWSVDGLFSYVRGRQTETSDNLYRMAPASSRISLHYHPQSYHSKLYLTLETQFYARQTKTALFNNEQSSAGYAIVGLSGRWSINQGLQLRAGISNLLNTKASHHLAGRNRITGEDLPVGAALPELGRSLYLGLQISW